MTVTFSFLSDIALKIIAAFVVILIGIVLGNILARITKTLINGLEIEKVLKSQGYRLPLEEGISGIVRYIVIITAIVWAVFQFGFSRIILIVLLVISLILLIAFIILAVKDFLPNLTAGFYLHHKDYVKEGEYIKSKSAEGKVIETGALETKIKTNNGEILIIPNSILSKYPIRKKKN